MSLLLEEEEQAEGEVLGPTWRVTAYTTSGGIRFAVKDVNELEVPLWVRKGMSYSDVVTIKVERDYK